MQATITFHEPTGKTIFPQTATGHVVRALSSKDPLDGGSVAILTTDRGHRNIDRLLAGEVDRCNVEDLLTGTVHILQRADCGLGCRCAVRIIGSKAKA